MKPAGRRAKGRDGENEVLKILEVEVGLKLVRNMQQTARGGRDIVEDTDRKQAPVNVAVEVKRQEVEWDPAWWTQTVEQAVESDRKPVLFFRRSRRPWRVAVDLADLNESMFPRDRAHAPAILDLHAGLQFIREVM